MNINITKGDQAKISELVLFANNRPKNEHTFLAPSRFFFIFNLQRKKYTLYNI
jgi:hypothetical protein